MKLTEIHSNDNISHITNVVHRIYQFNSKQSDNHVTFLTRLLKKGDNVIKN